MTLRGAKPRPSPLRTIGGVYPDIKEKTIYESTPPTVYLPRATFEARCGAATAAFRGEIYIVADPWK